MTEELKKALESVKTEEEMKAVAEKFEEEISKLSEEELDQVAGGDDYTSYPSVRIYLGHIQKGRQ